MAKLPIKKAAPVVEPVAPVAPAPDVLAILDVLDTHVRDQHRLIAACERAAVKGHGADSDRGLLLEAAQMIRALIGLSATDKLSHIPEPVYGPVEPAPPIGHSLPYTRNPGDSDR